MTRKATNMPALLSLRHEYRVPQASQPCARTAVEALRAMAACTGSGGICAWVDGGGRGFDPYAALEHSVELRRVIWVRCGIGVGMAEQVLSLLPLHERVGAGRLYGHGAAVSEQAARAADLLLAEPAVALVVLDLPRLAWVPSFMDGWTQRGKQHGRAELMLVMPDAPMAIQGRFPLRNARGRRPAIVLPFESVCCPVPDIGNRPQRKPRQARILPWVRRKDAL